MATAELEGDRIKIEAKYFEKDLVKQIAGTRFNYQDQAWYAPLSWGAAWQLKGVFGLSLQVGPNLADWSKREYDTRVGPAMKLKSTLELPADDGLYPYQEVGAQFLNLVDRVLLGDEMGTGKTVQAIVALKRKPPDGPILVVAPNSMVHTWQREFATWWPEMSVTRLEGPALKRRKTIVEQDYDVLVTNWEKLRLHSRLAPYGSIALKRCSDCDETSANKPASCHRCERELNEISWGAIIADEAHRAKNPTASQTRALWAIGKNTKIKYALTGSVIANKPDDLWAIMHFVAPDDWPSKGAFIDRYCLTSFSPWGSNDVVGLQPATKAEFFAILDPRMLRRTKEAVLPQLPPKVYSTRYVEMTPKQAKAYDQMALAMLAELEAGDIAIVTDALTKLRRLLQLTSAYAEINDDGQWRLSKPSSKLEALADIIEESNGAQMAVFAESRQLIQLAEKDLTASGITWASIHGEVSTLERELAIKKLEAGDIQVLLATLGAGGEGITLTAAGTLVFLERSYSMVKNKQAEDRLHRIGQVADQVEIIDLITEDTVDEHRLASMGTKAARLEEIVRDTEQLKKLLQGEAL